MNSHFYLWKVVLIARSFILVFVPISWMLLRALHPAAPQVNPSFECKLYRLKVPLVQLKGPDEGAGARAGIAPAGEGVPQVSRAANPTPWFLIAVFFICYM